MAFEVKKILVATDFSACSHHALELAIALAKVHGSSLKMVHVVPTSAYVDFTSGMEGNTAGAFQYLEALRESIQRSWKELEHFVTSEGLTVESMTVDGGVPAVELARIAREGQFSLVVMGTHGRSGLKHLVLGSVAEGVVRESVVPVLTARLP
jgi:universal stress protein A